MIAAQFQASATRFEIKAILKNLKQLFDEDCSTALVDSKGQIIDAELRHGIDLTSFDSIVKNCTRYVVPAQGEYLLTNDPYSGSPILSDLFFLKPIFIKNDLRYYLVLRISEPKLLIKDGSSIPKTVDEEGLRIPPTAIDTKGSVKGFLVEFLAPTASKAYYENKFSKIEAALNQAAKLLVSLPIAETVPFIQKYTEGLIRHMLDHLPDGEYTAQEFLDDDGFEKNPIKIQVKVSIHDKNVFINFAGTHKQVQGPYNCTYAMTLAACLWPFLSLIERPIPIHESLFKFLTIEAPEGTIVNARSPAAFLGGYFETSQRVADCVQLALSRALPQVIPALSGGSCNPSVIRFENEGIWLDTLASGLGASSKGNGLSGLHTGFHNLTQTPFEEIEKNYPVRILHNTIRSGSGGNGRSEGGHGVVRGLQFLKPAKVWCLSDRRTLKAHGLHGGSAGNQGETILVSSSKREKGPPHKRLLQVKAGDSLIIDSPGGGGWGKPEKPEEEDDAS